MTENELYNETLLLLGCGIVNGKVYDYDNNQYLIYNGNYITTTDSMIVHKRDVRFEPLRNAKLAEYLVQVMIKKEEEENGLYVTTMAIVENPRSVPPCVGKALSLVSNMGNITTNYYYNYCIACIELIHRLAQVPNTFTHFREFDYTREQLLKMYSDRDKRRSKK